MKRRTLALTLAGFVLAAVIIAAFLIYVGFRDTGIRVTVTNQSAATARDTHVIVLRHGLDYIIGDIQPGEKRSIRIHAAAESDAELRIGDIGGKPQKATVIGYFEEGYCGSTIAELTPDMQIRVREKVTLPPCYPWD